MSGKNSGEAVQLTDSIKFINADCMDIMSQYPDKYFDLAIVDPPYGIGISKVEHYNLSNKNRLTNYKKRQWDNAVPKKEYWQELFRVSINQAVWGGNYFTEYLPPSKDWIIWDKQQPEKMHFSQAELCWLSNGKGVRIFTKSINSSSNMSNNPKLAQQYLRIHPTQKPVKLYEWIYHNYAKPEFKILDTHLGSGSNAIAAHNYGISEFVGIELDPEYFADSIKRFNRVTAQLRMF